ncbi:MAG: PD-(D/E)XK nuclease family protein [DPANN group archaeon]|nr:PD-(D/E)XK nuclease family protein [DPANN group archaeon]
MSFTSSLKSYSHSRLGTFENCRLSYKYKYIDHIETEIENTVEAFMGSRVHDTLELLYKRLMFEKLLTLQELFDFYNKAWDKEWSDGILIVRDELSAEDYRKTGLRMIRDYYNHYQPFDQARTIALENQDFYPLDDNYKMHIRIDRLADAGDGVYEIHDYKTSNTLPTQEKADADRQLALYSLWVRDQYKDAKKVRLIWHYLQFDKEIVSERSDEQLAELKKDILALIKDVEQETEFKPKTSALCSWCAFKPICPAWKHELSVEDKPVEDFLKDDGVRLANEYDQLSEKIAALEQQKAKVRDDLFLFGKQHKVDTVIGSDVKLKLWSMKVHKFPGKRDPDFEELKMTVKALGKYNEVSDLDTFALSRKMGSPEWSEDIKKTIRRFSHEDEVQRIYPRKR